MHNEADLELRLLRAAHNDLNRRAVRHTHYDPAVNALVRQIIVAEREPHPVVAMVPMSQRICRAPRRAYGVSRGLIDR